MAVRRSPKFRFDYFLRSLPMEVIGRRCEHLMRAAEKEVEHLEKRAREEAGLPVEAEEGSILPPIELPSYTDIHKTLRLRKQREAGEEKVKLEQSVESIETEMKQIQENLKELNRADEVRNTSSASSKKRPHPADEIMKEEKTEEVPQIDESRGALGPDGDFVEFPDYDGAEPPKDPKKPFTQFCVAIRKEVKASLDPSERRNKVRLQFVDLESGLKISVLTCPFSRQEIVNGILRDKWLALSEEGKKIWRKWASWNKKRFARDMKIYEETQKASTANGKSNGDKSRKEQAPAEEDAMDKIQVPKKESSLPHVPKKRRWA